MNEKSKQRFGGNLQDKTIEKRIFRLLKTKEVDELNLLLGELRLRKGIGTQNHRVVRPITADAVLLMLKKGKRV